MLYTVILLTAFTIILLIKNYSSKFTWFFIIMVIGIDMSILAMVLNVAKIGNYRYPDSAFFTLDYKMFLKVSSLVQYSYYDTIRLLNCGISVFLFSVLWLVVTFTGTKTRKNYSILSVGRILLLSILPVFYIWFYDPNTSYNFYILLYDENRYVHLIRGILNSVHIINYIWVFIYLAYSVYLLFVHYKQTTITLVKKQIAAVIWSITLINSFLYFMFFIGPFRGRYIYHYTSNLLNFRDEMQIPFYYFNLIPLIVFIIIDFMLIILLKTGAIETYGFFKDIIIKRNMKGINENLRGVFHSFKNTIFTIKILSERAETEYNSEGGLEALRGINDITTLSLFNLSRVMNAIKTISLKPSVHDIAECMDSAIEQLDIRSEIVMIKDYAIEDIYSYVDYFHITESFRNIIQNSIDALDASNKQTRTITIKLYSEKKWVVANITDNGIGINKKVIKKLFKTFYSTKENHTSWGVGLSYVNRIVKAHLGFITVNSVENEYTTFEILLLKAKKEGKKVEKNINSSS